MAVTTHADIHNPTINAILEDVQGNSIGDCVVISIASEDNNRVLLHFHSKEQFHKFIDGLNVAKTRFNL